MNCPLRIPGDAGRRDDITQTIGDMIRNQESDTRASTEELLDFMNFGGGGL